MILSRILPNARWKLLRALWADSVTGTIRSLARQSGLSYSSAHAELNRLERARLARSSAVGNSLVFQANRKNPAAKAVDELVRASVTDTARDECPEPHEVLAQLEALGAPVHSGGPPQTPAVPEDAVAQGLRLARRDPVLTRAFPVLLARTLDRLDLDVLRQRATAIKEKQTLGFFLELTAVLTEDQDLRLVAKSLKDRRIKKSRDFFERLKGRRARRLAEQRTPEVARNWNFRIDMDLENFRQLFRKFCDAR